MFKIDSFKREYCDGGTQVVTFRLPVKIKKKLDAFAEENGRTTTDVVVTALDQFLQFIEKSESKKSRS